MKFGNVKNPELIDFSLPEDHPDTAQVLASEKPETLQVYVGCPKWNRTDLKGFYPRGTKDELTYYASQFNCVELNATFYNKFSTDQIANWADKTPQNFKFFPKMHQMVSHLKRLNKVDDMVEEFCNTMAGFEDRLGMVFTQMHDNFKYKDFDRLTQFIELFPDEIPLAVELRNTEYFNDPGKSENLYQLLEDHHITNIITDTAGRRDLLHMRLTTPHAFIRFVGANHSTDFTRLEDWVDRIKSWHGMGLRHVYFFVHQNIEREIPLLAAHFVQQLNKALDTNLHVPQMAGKMGSDGHSNLKLNF